MILLADLGRELRRMRIASGLTRVEVEQRTRIGFATLIDIEEGKADPTLETLRNLTKLYGEPLVIGIEP